MAHPIMNASLESDRAELSEHGFHGRLNNLKVMAIRLITWSAPTAHSDLDLRSQSTLSFPWHSAELH